MPALYQIFETELGGFKSGASAFRLGIFLSRPANYRKVAWLGVAVAALVFGLPNSAKTAVLRHKARAYVGAGGLHQAVSLKSTGASSQKHKLAGHTRDHHVTQYSGSERKVVLVKSKSHHHLVAHQKSAVAKPKARYAYPLDFFLAAPPLFDSSPLPAQQSAIISSAFAHGVADQYSPRALVKAGVVAYHPIHGGIFWRREPIKFIIIHSTEPVVPQIGQRIIDSWSSLGRRHPGAQYVVDRDGTITQALDPDLATVHVNIFKTLPGINNDNSVGIEMCHSGHQDYPYAQVEAVTKLVIYLQNRYHVVDADVITHRYAQQGDHTDPVNFDWAAFVTARHELSNSALALKMKELNNEALSWIAEPNVAPVAPAAPPDNFLQIHRQLNAHDNHGETKAEKNPPRFAGAGNGSAPILRGPIEMSPGAATILDSASEAPLPGIKYTGASSRQ